MSNYISIRFNDLSEEKQEELIEWKKELLLEEYKTAGEELLTKHWYEPQPGTWQEAYWRDSHTVDDDEIADTDFSYQVEMYAEEQAQLLLVTAFKYAEVEI